MKTLLKMCFAIAIVLCTGSADCQPARTTIQSVSISVQPDATSITIETSADTPIRLLPGTDRLEVEFPHAEWRARPPRIDRHAGLIESFRRTPVAEGIHLVFMTRGEFTVRDGGPAATAANGDRIITLIVAPPAAAPLVTVTGDGPVVIEGSGYVVPNTAPVKQAPAPVVQQSVECTAALKQQGTLNGKPVVGFSDCPSTMP